MPARMTIRKAINEFLIYLEIDKGYARRTVEDYRRHLGSFTDWIAGANTACYVSDINGELVKAYRLHIAHFSGSNGKGLKRATQGYYLIALRVWLRYLSVQRDLDVFAADRIGLPKPEPRTVSFLNPQQLKMLLSKPNIKRQRGLRDRAILEVLWSTGLRLAELTGLDRHQIDLESREFSVIGKGSKPRVYSCQMTR